MASPTTLHRSLELAGTLPALMVAADRVAATVIQGVHGRRRVGQGDAFWQYRPYRDGDSASQIDWRQSARSRHLFVRETEWEAAASVWLWRDASPSMQYASLRNTDTKAVRGELLTLALASLLADAGERVAVLGGGMRPTSGRGAVRRIAETLLRHYASGGVRGHLVQVLDPAEEDLPFDGHVKFEGLEAEGQHTIRRVEAVRTAYGARLAAQKEGLQRLTRSTDWTGHLHRTDKSPQTVLLSLYLAMADLRRLSVA